MRIALGSSAELRTQLYLAQRLEKCDLEKCQTLVDQTQKISAQLVNLIKHRQSKDGSR